MLDQHHTASAAFIQILVFSRIGYAVGVESGAFIGNGSFELYVIEFHCDMHEGSRPTLVAMANRVQDRLFHRHVDTKRIFVRPSMECQLV